MARKTQIGLVVGVFVALLGATVLVLRNTNPEEPAVPQLHDWEMAEYSAFRGDQSMGNLSVSYRLNGSYIDANVQWILSTSAEAPQTRPANLRLDAASGSILSVFADGYTSYPYGAAKRMPTGPVADDADARPAPQAIAPFGLQWFVRANALGVPYDAANIETEVQLLGKHWEITASSACTDCDSPDNFRVSMRGGLRLLPDEYTIERDDEAKMLFARIDAKYGLTVDLNISDAPAEVKRAMAGMMCGFAPCESDATEPQYSLQRGLDALIKDPQWIQWSAGRGQILPCKLGVLSDVGASAPLASMTMGWTFYFFSAKGVAALFELYGFVGVAGVAPPPVVTRYDPEVLWKSSCGLASKLIEPGVAFELLPSKIECPTNAIISLDLQQRAVSDWLSPDQAHLWRVSCYNPQIRSISAVFSALDGRLNLESNRPWS